MLLIVECTKKSTFNHFLLLTPFMGVYFGYDWRNIDVVQKNIDMTSYFF